MSAKFALSCAAQSYEWGRVGEASAVARFAQSGDPAFVLAPERPYAELWMGAHPKAPSKLLVAGPDTGKPLGQWLREHPEALGSRVLEHYGGDLPFLFKVLSVNKALSIQAHPDKALAEHLFATDPQNYPDNNHKPEIAVALTDFEGMCGFRPLLEIAEFLHTVPELQAVVGADNARRMLVDRDEQGLRAAFRGLMTQARDVVAVQLRLLVARLEHGAPPSLDAALKALILRLYAQYPDDGGCFCVFFLNVVRLAPGAAMFLGPNEPHAYLDGDCIECMACSDNVVRAGLTPKFKDVEQLCSMLTYAPGPAASKVFHGKTTDDTTSYEVPVADFQLARTCVRGTSRLAVVNGPSIFIVTEGAGTVAATTLVLQPGVVVFAGANAEVIIHGHVTVFRAFCTE